MLVSMRMIEQFDYTTIEVTYGQLRNFPNGRGESFT